MPIIRTLLSSGNTVILGTTSLTEKIFKQEFPELERVNYRNIISLTVLFYLYGLSWDRNIKRS
ncbi:MAG: hypothetical protein IPG08_05145 [Sphingobacteriaceae bacterium]|nr:hypothetical protein [Sphingobacteriaceae bacterium]